ncbi:MAG: 4Fe-4S binding protein [Bacteroidetes bacterium]|nr:4Fe-4S binding protein [Bacteroidota bacterium]
MKIVLKSETVRIASTLAAFFMALPLGLKGLTGIFVWTSPFIMLNSIIILKSFVVLNLLGTAVLLVVIFKNRFFCRYMCPAGFCCDKISGISRTKVSIHKKMPAVGSWLALISLAAAFAGIPLLILLDPLAIFHGTFSILSGDLSFVTILSLSGFPLLLAVNYIFPDIWCSRICPLGGLQDLLTDIRRRTSRLIRRKPQESDPYSPARRFFLASGLGLISGFVLPKLISPSRSQYIRPPASVEPATFNTLCIRCGNCIKSCPTNIITNHTDYSDLTSWMTPEINFGDGYCLETCNLCSSVCPTGSITHFSPDAKKIIFMGSAVVNYKECLLAHNKECDRCMAACKYNAVKIVPASRLLLMTPEIDQKKCVGCGACAVICPTSAINMIPPLAV